MRDLEKFKNEMNLSGKNVYVGNRYAPVLDDGGWDKTKEYEPLTIIQHEGDSYIARTWVPKGIDILNKDFWYSIGVYNAQIASYRKRVEEVETGLNTFKGDIATLETKVDNNYTTLDTKIDTQFNTLDQNLTTLKDSLSITPSAFEGNDLEQIQQAVEVVKALDGGVIRLEREYDITGLGSVKLNKIDARDRRVIVFTGDGGSIRKDDVGYMFDSDIQNSGDWYFNNVVFKSIEGADTTVLNAANIIRVQFNNVHLRNVDHYLKADNRYMQTIYITGGSAVGGKGWLIESPCYYDVVIGTGFYCEHREHFLIQSAITEGQWKSINGLRIIGSMFEGLSGKTFELLRIEEMTIDGNYFESNKGGYIDLTKADYVDAVNISNNRVYHHPDTNTNNLTSFIQWGGRLRGVSSRNNFSRYLAMHDTTSVIESVNYLVHSYQDVAMDNARNDINNIDTKNQVFKIGKPYQLTNNDELGSYVNNYSPTENVNNLVKSGVYHVQPTSENTPNSEQFSFIEVFNKGNFIMQRATVRSSGLGQVFVRFRESGTWSSWKRVDGNQSS